MTNVRTRPCPALATAITSLFLSLALAASACQDNKTDSVRDTEPAPADAPPALLAAHEAYLAGDYVQMGEWLEEVIVDPRAGELARDNAFALLESAYDATRGQLPAHAALPSTVRVMTLGVLNGGHPWGPHRLIFLDMHVAEGRARHIVDIRVTRLPGEPILSLADNLGAMSVTPLPDGFENVKLQLRNLDVLPDRGAFAIQVEFDDAPAIDVVVLANKLVASDQPEVTSPEVGEVLKDPHPEIAWHPFRSPEFAPWEKRSVYLGISSDATKGTAWDYYQWEPGDLDQVRVGDPGTTPATLEPGSYWLDLMCAEQRAYGGIQISRATNAARPFSVVR